MDKIILLLKYIIVALVQGVGEILPISSSGHMLLTQRLLGLSSNDLSFEIFLHFASLIAIICFFYKKIWLMIKSFCLYIFKKETRTDEEIKHHFKLCIYLIIATIPAGIVGLLLNDFIETKLTYVWLVGIFLIITSGLLYISTKIKRTKTIKEMSYLDALVFGLFQCLGILPGISRSGSCIVGGSTRKIEQNDCAEFAFIMAIPIMFASAILSVSDISSALANKSLVVPYIVAFFVTLVVTYFSLKFFLKIIRRQKLTFFSIYCLVVGVISIVLGIIFKC